MSIANVVAGISRISLADDIVDKNYNAVPIGLAKYLSDTLPNTERMNNLLLMSITEALATLNACKPVPKPVHLILGLPSERPGLDDDLEATMKNRLEELGITIDIQFTIEIVRRDHDSGLVGLQKTREICKSNPEAFVLIACVDSFVSKKTIQWLEQTKVLYCSANKKGYTPGEASACCLVCTEETARKYRLPIRAKIVGVSSDMEPSKINNTLVNAGRGLAEAMNDVLKSLPEGES
ncbi:MAG: hypothetical protein MJE63_13055, partial [Proteobacteria bacterium]|nr:hypothetical protein [Pseudomonadota bacterium]